MNILHYNLDTFDFEYVEETVRFLNEKGIETIAIPKDFNLLLECDLFTLHCLKEKIEKAIRQKENINNN